MLEAILLILFTAIFAYIAWWKLDWALTLCVVFLPVYLIRFEIGFLPMTILEVMILVIFVVWLVKIFGRGVPLGSARDFQKASTTRLKWQERCKGIIWPWKWLTLAFVIVGGIAVFVSPDLRAAAGLWKAYILEPVILFVVFVNVIETKEQLLQIFWGLGASVVVIGFVAMLQYLNIVDIPAHYGLETPRRATSVFPFPTAVGKFVGPIVAFFIGFFVVRGLRTARSLWALVCNNIFVSGVILFGLMGLLFSVSRGALIGVVAALLFSSFFSKRKMWIWFGIGIVIIVALAIPQTRDNITGVFSATDVSTDVRLVMWKGAWRIIQDNPILGTGLASFPIVYDDYKEASHTEYFPNPDQLYLTLWIEMGIAGLIVFGWIIIQFFISARHLMRNYRSYAVGLMAAVVAILVYGFLDTQYFKNDLAVQFWVLLGITVVLQRWAITRVKTPAILQKDK
ncbi:MAG TPA: O-antigen ligase family protein [Thioploca sp.]|nr:O-antigen ligase family protein [Thioploca sp.]